MSLATGTRLGAYEIIALLGAGGMGQVYRARDTKLNRHVAIKVLPDGFADDPDRLTRFTREAQTLAALNHPNIAHIHGLEEFDGVAALVMELVEGEDLSVHIARGPMPLSEALPIARQIAEALEAAHEEGFIHRDLKPANIKVRADGTVKLLDFGLAKALVAETQDGGSRLADSPTFTSPAMTAAGVILGTAAYMAPEQARGRRIDRRADIWAFGVVFYEMLTGARLFDGSSVPETLALIFTREPDVNALPPGTPAGIRRIIARCLVKDPRQRLRDAGDARLLIDDALEGRVDPTPSTTAGAIKNEPDVRRRPSWWLPAAAVALALAAAAAGWLMKPVPPTSPIRLSIALPAGFQVTSAPAISPDGRQIAYAAGRTPDTSQLYLRAVDSFDARAMPGSAGAQYPFFSPDGRSVAFFSGGRLRRAAVAGGAPADLAGVPTPWGGTWCADGSIIYAASLGSGLWRIGPDGGKPEQLTKPDGAGAGYAHVFPQRLPGTDDILFQYWGQTFYSAVLSIKSGTWRQVTQSEKRGTTSIYSPTGHLLSSDEAGDVVAAPWRPTTSGVVHAEAPVLQKVYWGVASQYAWVSVAENGTVVYVPGNAANRRMVWVDRQGRVTPVPGDASMIYQAMLSHDGRRVAYGTMTDQWIVDLDSGARTRAVSDTRSWFGAWLPGDDRIVFSSNRDGDWDLYTVSTNGGELHPLLKRPFAQHVEAVAPDGTMVFMERHPATGNDLWKLLPDGRAVPLVVTPFSETAATISADGRFVAYVSDESGSEQVYAMPMTGQGPRTVVTADGGTGPVWSRDGKELFYRAGDDLMSVQVQTRDTLVLGRRQKLLDLSGYDSGYLHDFDVSADGQRFLLIRTDPESRPTRLDVVTNWSDELRALGGK